MSSKLFTLKVLSSSPDAGIRSLRGFAASMGGTAELLPPREFDLNSITLPSENAQKTVLLIDATLPDGQALAANFPGGIQEQIPENIKVFLFVPDFRRTIPDWAATKNFTGVIGGSTIAGMDYAVLRCIFSCFISGQCEPEASSMLRWGYASSLWMPASKISVAHGFTDFMKKISLPPAAERAHVAFLEATVSLLPARGSVNAGLIACDGVNSLSSLTLSGCDAVFGADLPRALADIDAQAGTIVQINHGSQLMEISLLRPVNGLSRGDGKSTLARPATLIRMTAPNSNADAAPSTRIVWTEAG